MEWSDEDRVSAEREAIKAADISGLPLSMPPEAVFAIMTRAVEIVAARGGTMGAERLRHQLAAVREHMGPTTAQDLGTHLAAQGARIAELEQRLAERGNS